MENTDDVHHCTTLTKIKDLAPGDIFSHQSGLVMNIHPVILSLPIQVADGTDTLGSMRGMYAVVCSGDSNVVPIHGDKMVYRTARPSEAGQS